MEVWNGIWKKILIWNGIWKKILVWNGRFLVWNGNGMEEKLPVWIMEKLSSIPYHAQLVLFWRTRNNNESTKNIRLLPWQI